MVIEAGRRIFGIVPVWRNVVGGGVGVVEGGAEV